MVGTAAGDVVVGTAAGNVVGTAAGDVVGTSVGDVVVWCSECEEGMG